MAKIKKKGTSGTAKNYLTRSQAVRKLQIPLSDFRRLCIFKGIYPREPRSRKRAATSSTPSTTFYYTKDIHYLLHEPLLAKFREQKSVAKKISKALGRNELSDAGRLEKNLTPRLTLDHVVKERYPTFIDALRDLDDALSLLCLFATLPSTLDVPAKTIARCQRLTLEFEHYLIRAHALRKSFLSIKGIYYQATIQGQDILWLVPYKFVQRTGGDVDFRIMATFVEFYTALLGFVNFRLYTSIGLVYPPRFVAEAEERGAELGAFQLEGTDGEGRARIESEVDAERNERAQAEADRLLSLPSEDQQIEEDAAVITNGETEENDDSAEPSSTTTLDQFVPIDSGADTLLQPSLTADPSAAARLFEPFTFYLSRETPRHPLEFLLKAFGCKRVGWDSSVEGADPGSYCQDENDERITHQIVDRPDLPVQSAEVDNEDGDEDGGAVVRKANERVPGRIYVQPQWVWDCINTGQLQRPDLYAPGAVLPPHLSPWVKRKEGVYDPTAPLAEQEEEYEGMQEEAGETSDGVEVEDLSHGAEKMTELVEQEEEEEDDGMDVELAASEDDDDDESADEHTATNGGAEDDEWGGLSGDEDAIPDVVDDVARRAQAELEAEALGRPIETSVPSKAKTKQAARSREQREKQEDLERRKMMMPRLKRKMFEKMTYSNARKDEEAERLRAKRRRIEREREKGTGVDK